MQLANGNMAHKNKANIGNPGHIWAIPAIHSDAAQLTKIHDQIFDHIKPGDRILYHGNYTGYNAGAVDTVNELLAFRRMVLAMPGMLPSDFVYLKGIQEEMLLKLLQLQFAPNAEDVLLWMLGNGLQATLQDYGVCPHEGLEASRHGIMGLTRWTQDIRSKIRNQPGHEAFILAQQPIAHTCPNEHASPLLFVHAGINISKPVDAQGDSIWWESQNFETIMEPYRPFQKVVRGYDPAHKGMMLNCVTATLDDGCGFGGDLICAGFDEAGQVAGVLN